MLDYNETPIRGSVKAICLYASHYGCYFFDAFLYEKTFRYINKTFRYKSNERRTKLSIIYYSDILDILDYKEVWSENCDRDSGL